MACLLVAACTPASAASPPATAPAASVGSTVRHPDGVFEARPTTLPAFVDRSDDRGVIALRTPLPASAIEKVIDAYLDAFTKEDSDGLAALLTPDAAPLEGRGGRGGLLEGWRTRMKNFDFSLARGRQVAQLDRVERFEWDDLEGPEAALLRAPPRPPRMRVGDILVVAPLAPVRAAFGEPLFGEELVLLLRAREDGAYAIVGAAEGDAPPGRARGQR